MTEKEQSGGAGLHIRRVISYVILIFLTIICLLPFYILLINCTRNHVDIQKGFTVLPGSGFARNFKNLMNNPNLPVLRGMLNSFIVATGSAILTTYFSSLTAYAIHAYDFRGKKVIFTFILMIMMVPTQVSALGFVELIRNMKLMNSFIPLIVPSIAAPVVFFFMKQYMDSALPIEIVEAARIDGSHEFRVFNTIVLPIMKPAISVQTIFAFTSSWNNYFIPSLILDKKNRKTLPILIAQLRSADFLKFDLGQVYMMIAISIFPVVIVYLFVSKSIVQGVALGSVKG
ncbi:MAG: carbohydrate ABC transporter permease [Lachnospiraceae bacterium]|nr:carbohydrate ABC transporter permease [Lachnospiraceae bacterium]